MMALRSVKVVRSVVTAAVLAAVATGAALAGCGQSLDAFLYQRTRVNEYQLPAEGRVPEETVAADRLEVVSIPVNDQVTLGAVYVHALPDQRRGHLIYFHGQCCNLEQHIDRAKRLSNLGYDVLAFDYRGWGTSTDVAPTEPGLLEDSRAVLAWFVARTGVPASRLTYYGRSFGAAVATQLAEVEPPAVLVLESAFASVARLKEDSTRMDFPVGYISEGTWDNVARIARVDAAVLLLHGLADDFVRPEFSEEIFAAARDPKSLVLVPGADHGSIPRQMGEGYGATLHEWISVHTPAAP